MARYEIQASASSRFTMAWLEYDRSKGGAGYQGVTLNYLVVSFHIMYPSYGNLKSLNFRLRRSEGSMLLFSRIFQLQERIRNFPLKSKLFIEVIAENCYSEETV